MLAENKTGRYLKYAIGEIILVMIGILLALQVNTWNNNRELKKEELKMMKSLHQEFSENLERFDFIYNWQLKRKKNIETIKSIDSRMASADSLASLIGEVNKNPTFDPLQGIYNSVINSGKIELISNDILKSRISRFQDLIIDYKEEENEAREFAKYNLHPYLLKQPTMELNNKPVDSKSSSDSIVKENYIKVVESFEYKKLLSYLIAWMGGIFEEGPGIKDEMNAIINLLESEIEKHEN